MKKFAKTFLLVLLIASFCLTSMVACQKKEEEVPSGTVSTSGHDGVDENGYILDSLPELNYNNETINILHWVGDIAPEFSAEDQGNAVEAAVFARNLNVSERLKIKLNWIPENVPEGSSYSALLDKDFQSGDYSYDILASYSQSIATATLGGYTRDLSKLQYLDLSKPWWPNSLTDKAKIGNNKLYFVSGDISTNALNWMYATFFNKAMLEQYHLENPYDLVEKNQWTIDKMFEMSKNIYTDFGEAGKDVSDELGIIVPWLSIDAYFYSSGLLTTDKDSKGNLVISDTYISKKAQDLAEKLVNKLFHDDSGLWLRTDTGSCNQAFGAGRVLFITQRPRDAAEFQGENMEYGVVPTPKWDSDQESYLTCIGNPFTLYAVYAGVSNERMDQMGAVLEAFASAAYRITTPTMFDVTIKIRYAHDPTASKMYDIIRENIVFDIGRMFGSSMGQLTQTKYRNMIGEGEYNWITTANGFKLELQTYLEMLNEELK